MKIVTMQEIAEDCNKSVTTVSNVLNNKGKFSKKTRDAVVNSAKHLGYVTDYSLYDEKVLAIGVGSGIEATVGRKLIRTISSIALSHGLVPQLYHSNEHYPYMIVVGDTDEREREGFRRSSGRVVFVSDTGDVPMGICTTEKVLVETLRTLEVFHPLIIYDDVAAIRRFSHLDTYQNLCVQGLEGRALLDAIEDFGQKPLVLLCPHRPEAIFSALQERVVNGLTILVEYLPDASIDDRGMRYLRFDIYSRELLEDVISQLTGDVCDLERCRGRSSVTLMGGI